MSLALRSGSDFFCFVTLVGKGTILQTKFPSFPSGSNKAWTEAQAPDPISLPTFHSGLREDEPPPLLSAPIRSPWGGAIAMVYMLDSLVDRMKQQGSKEERSNDGGVTVGVVWNRQGDGSVLVWVFPVFPMKATEHQHLSPVKRQTYLANPCYVQFKRFSSEGVVSRALLHIVVSFSPCFSRTPFYSTSHETHWPILVCFFPVAHQVHTSWFKALLKTLGLELL